MVTDYSTLTPHPKMRLYPMFPPSPTKNNGMCIAISCMFNGEFHFWDEFVHGRVVIDDMHIIGFIIILVDVVVTIVVAVTIIITIIISIIITITIIIIITIIITIIIIIVLVVVIFIIVVVVVDVVGG